MGKKIQNRWLMLKEKALTWISLIAGICGITGITVVSFIGYLQNKPFNNLFIGGCEFLIVFGLALFTIVILWQMADEISESFKSIYKISVMATSMMVGASLVMVYIKTAILVYDKIVD
jgi:hypothetical protein